jgi:cyclopropane fatty-acyl-phospholipid synthase-like methyltransferase
VRIRGVLAHPLAFRAFYVLIGAERSRQIFVREHVRPEAGQRLLDIGCGTGEMVPFLAGVDYVGFDESSEYVRAAQARYPAASFSCDRIESYVSSLEAYDLAMASGVLHHLNDEQALELLRLAHASLRPGGRLITLDGCYAKGQSTVSRWLLARDRGRYVRSREEYLRLMGAVFSEVNAVLRDDLLRIPYTHLIAECARA